jgi:diaminopimelate decarboxylase
LRLFNQNGIKIDASSEYEAFRAIKSWYNPSDVQLSWQEMPKKLEKLLDLWVYFVATSIHQLEEVWKYKQGSEVWVRINPWVWSWAFAKIATGWKTSSFGIWHEYIPQIQEIAEKYDLKITKIHLHIGSENTPESWVNTANIGLDFAEKFQEVDKLDMWWGFKMAIMPYEKTADLQAIWDAVKAKFEDFYAKTGRKIHLEVEPWKYMVINSSSVVAKVVDIVDTWVDWYKFIKVDTGMTEMPRITMYWVQQKIIAINDNTQTEKYAVVWHCCESWDLLTCKLYDQEVIEVIELPKVSIWDTIIFESTWAYNSSMSMKNYNSFPEAWEVLIRSNWEIHEIRKREKFEDIWRNEVEVI